MYLFTSFQIHNSYLLQQENRDTERVSNTAKVTELGNNKTKIQARFVWSKLKLSYITPMIYCAM